MDLQYRLRTIAKGVYGIAMELELNNSVYVVKVDKENRNSVADERITHIMLYKALQKKQKGCELAVPEPVIDQEEIGKIMKMYNIQTFHAMERVEGKTLYEFLKKHHHDVGKTQKVVRNLKNAILCMWKAGFIHSDLHLDNIIVTPKLGVKLIDFGMTTRVTPLQDDVLHSDTKQIQTWFSSFWPAILESLKLQTGNPNVHAYGLYKRYPKQLKMFAKKDATVFKHMHNVSARASVK